MLTYLTRVRKCVEGVFFATFDSRPSLNAHMRNKVLFLLAAALGIYGCSAEGELNDLSDKKLVGNWTWTKTEDFDPEQYHERLITPDISNSSASLEFTDDGFFTQKKNNVETKSGYYDLPDESTLILMSDQDTLDFNYEISSSSLILEDISDSGVVFTYVRAR